MDDKKTDWLAVGKRLTTVTWIAVKTTAKAVAWVAKHTFNGVIAVTAVMATVFVHASRLTPESQECVDDEEYSIYASEGEASIDDLTGDVVYTGTYRRKMINC